MQINLIRLLRQCGRPKPPGRKRAGRLLLIAVLLIALTACRPVPVTQTSLTSCSVSDSSGTTSDRPSADPSGSGNQSGSTTNGGSSSETTGGTSGPTDSTSGETGFYSTDTSTVPISSQTSSGQTSLTVVSGTLAPTVKPTVRPTNTPTVRPTSTPTTKPANTPTTASGTFPYRNYGTFFRDNYGTNSNIVTSDDGGISIDTGCAPYGVALVKIDGIPADKRCKVIATGNSKSYQYDILTRGQYMGIPLQNGNGTYTITVYEQVSGTSFTTKMAHSFSVSLASSLKPFTAASVMVDFSRNSACVGKANSLCSGIDTATGRVDAIYRWIVGNITYDRELANSITSNQVTVYIPNPDTTYTTKKGICFDYAALMCAMLRSQGIPTRLIIGQTSLGYHAWNEVYFEGQGWVVVASFRWQQIDGSGWVMFDSTFAAGGMTPENIQSTTHTKQKIY